MTLLYDGSVFQRHDTGVHPESAERVARIAVELERLGLDQQCRRVTWPPAERSVLETVHHRGYIDAVDRFAGRGGGRIEADTAVCDASFDVARVAAGAVVDATRRVLSGEDRQALCLVRPPGHHALPRSAMGFCLFNNIAIGAQMALREHGLERVLIVDWDVHHGNGTQDVFWTEPRVGVLSIHRYPFYPGTGSEHETGEGPGLGTTCNLPIRFGTSRKDYFARFTRSLDALADRLRPELVMVSAGFDAHAADPVGSLGLEDEDFATLTRHVLDVTRQHAQGRLISVLEGGYHLSFLPSSVAAHLEALLADRQ
jgi:acetoin utilization deacetylase AcuC-like enzyme